MRPFLDEQASAAHKWRNTLHTAALLAGLGVVVGLSTVLLLGWRGLGWTVVIIGLMLALAPRIPPEAVMRMYRARPVDPRQGGQLNRIVEVLAERAELPAPPKLYVIPSMTLNAFATGTPQHAAIAITEGLLRRLTMREVAGVLAHETSHVRNNDLTVMALADVLSRLSVGLAYVAVFLAVLNVLGWMQGEQHASWLAIGLLYMAPTLSSLLQLGLSRAREYDADLEGAQLTGDPLGLASALRRLEHTTGRFWEDMMFPMPGRRVGYPSLLRSHPSTEDRVRRLLELSGQPMLPPLVITEEPLISLVGFGPIQMQPRYRFPGIWF